MNTKKLTAVLMVLLLLLSLCGCGGEKDPGNAGSSDNNDITENTAGSGSENNENSENAEAAGPAAGTPLSDFYQAIMDAQPQDRNPLILFEENNPDLIDSFYPGLDELTLSQKAFYMPPIVTHPCEIVLVEVSDPADAQKVADIFQARIDSGADNPSYPESAAGWLKYAQIQQSGNFLCMIVLPEGYTIPENIFAA